MTKWNLFILWIGAAVFLTGCSTSAIEQVDVYEMESFSAVKPNSVMTYTNSEEVETFVNAFENAKKEPGVVDMYEPDYRVEFGEESYFLWISPDQGAIMNENETHTIYSLSTNAANKIDGLLNSAD